MLKGVFYQLSPLRNQHHIEKTKHVFLRGVRALPFHLRIREATENYWGQNPMRNRDEAAFESRALATTRSKKIKHAYAHDHAMPLLLNND
jgi:hypothetical protein